MNIPALRKEVEQRRTALMNTRSAFEGHWKDLRAYIQPFRGRFEGERFDQKQPSMSKILRSEALRARRTLAAGMQSGLTSPSRQWFKLTVANPDLATSLGVQEWCDEVQRRMLEIMAGSSFYQSLHSLYDEVCVFGTGALLITPDYNDVIKCTALTVGEYALGCAMGQSVDSLYRDFWMTAGAMVSEFGEANCSPSVVSIAQRTPDELMLVHQAIEPSGEGGRFPYRSVYWEDGGPSDAVLRVSGFRSQPFQTPRWHVTSGGVYGYGPGSEVLPDVKSLQVMQRDLLEGLRKKVDPPLVMDSSLQGKDVDTRPGGKVFVPSGNVQSMARSLYDVNIDLRQLGETIQDVVRNINSTMYVDLFLMLQSQPSDKEMTAREVIERHDEKMLALGPVLERLEGELLTPAIERIYSIMEEDHLLPEAPEEMQGQNVKIEYVSVLAQAQKMMSIKSVEQLVAFAGGLTAADPTAMDAIDVPTMVREYGTIVGVPAKILRSEKEVEALQAQRMQAQQRAQQVQEEAVAAQAVNQGAQGAKVLSEMDVGNDALNALFGSANSFGGV